MLPCVCLVIDHRRRQNVVRTSVTHSAKPRVPLYVPYISSGDIAQLYCTILIKLRYNARFDWLKERALSEYRARSDKDGPISVFASFGILANLSQK